mmetsp:Transcript_36700/g.85266  ORF Transcript_36700/g.85266 Transcript_36700/m.85266 type:complete len:288 (+) Transcript_36700:354-1217(+)
MSHGSPRVVRAVAATLRVRAAAVRGASPTQARGRPGCRFALPFRMTHPLVSGQVPMCLSFRPDPTLSHAPFRLDREVVPPSQHGVPSSPSHRRSHRPRHPHSPLHSALVRSSRTRQLGLSVPLTRGSPSPPATPTLSPTRGERRHPASLGPQSAPPPRRLWLPPPLLSAQRWTTRTPVSGPRCPPLAPNLIWVHQLALCWLPCRSDLLRPPLCPPRRVLPLGPACCQRPISALPCFRPAPPLHLLRAQAQRVWAWAWAQMPSQQPCRARVAGPRYHRQCPAPADHRL